MDLTRLLRPRSVAVVGASERDGSYAGETLLNLRAAGFGGRGYMRTNVAERFFRELRVDRIWEGTSEIQRLIIARALERRGVERTLH